MLSLGNTPSALHEKQEKTCSLLSLLSFLCSPPSALEAARGPTTGRHGQEKGWPPSGGLIWGPLAASWGLSSVFSLVSSLLSLLSSLFSLLSSLFSLLLAVVVLRGLDPLSSLFSLLSSLFSRCCSFPRSHFALITSNFASSHRIRFPLARPFASPSLARRNARSDEINTNDTHTHHNTNMNIKNNK